MQDFTLISKRCDPANQQATSKPTRRLLRKDYKYVSISHKGSLLVGVGSIKPCGIDTEILKSKHASFKKFVINGLEQKIIRDPVIAWSVKESCFKVFNDGYEPRDFKILGFGNGSYRVESDNYKYSVTVIIAQGYVTAIAFVASEE